MVASCVAADNACCRNRQRDVIIIFRQLSIRQNEGDIKQFRVETDITRTFCQICRDWIMRFSICLPADYSHHVTVVGFIH